MFDSFITADDIWQKDGVYDILTNSLYQAWVSKGDDILEVDLKYQFQQFISIGCKLTFKYIIKKSNFEVSRYSVTWFSDENQGGNFQDVAIKIIPKGKKSEQMLFNKDIMLALDNVCATVPMRLLYEDVYNYYYIMPCFDGNLLEQSILSIISVYSIMQICEVVKAQLRCIIDTGWIYTDLKLANIMYLLRHLEEHSSLYLAIGDLDSCIKADNTPSTYIFTHKFPHYSQLSSLSEKFLCVLVQLGNLYLELIQRLDQSDVEAKNVLKNPIENYISVSHKCYHPILRYFTANFVKPTPNDTIYLSRDTMMHILELPMNQKIEIWDKFTIEFLAE